MTDAKDKAELETNSFDYVNLLPSRPTGDKMYSRFHTSYNLKRIKTCTAVKLKFIYGGHACHDPGMSLHYLGRNSSLLGSKKVAWKYDARYCKSPGSPAETLVPGAGACRVV